MSEATAAAEKVCPMARWKHFQLTTSTTAQTLTPLAIAVSSVTRTGRTVTVVTGSPHNITGQFVLINGADQAVYNGKKAVTIVNATTFTFTIPTNGNNEVADVDLPVSPATGTITMTEVHHARRFQVRTGVNGSDTVGIGPNANANYYEIPASTIWAPPDLPDGEKIDLSEWYVQASGNTPVIDVIYV